MLEDRYSPNTHILDCDILFNTKPNIYQIYNYQDVNYIISDLPEFNPDGGLSTGVKLLKVNDIDNYVNPYGIEEGYLKINYFDLITQNSIRVNNLIEYKGGDNIVTGGIDYGVNSNDLNNNLTISNPNTNFSFNVTGLTKNTLYYFRPYMISSTGIYTYGEIKECRTLDDYSVPTINAVGVSNISFNTATVTGVIISEGGDPITEYGVLIDYSPNPTINTNLNKYIVGSSVVYTNFIYNLTSLSPGTQYYVRFYAINENGVGYSSSNLIFSTLNASLPTVVTATLQDIIDAGGDYPTPLGMTGGGYDIELNGGTIISKGWVAKIEDMPTTTDYDIIYNINTTTNIDNFWGFSFSYLNEIANTVLHYRAYVETNIGINYGQVEYIDIPNYEVPNVTTNESTNITKTGATLSATFDNNGYNPNYGFNNLGFVYSASVGSPEVGVPGCTYVTTPGVSLDGVTKTKNIINLVKNTTYYYRAVGTNSIGYGYGIVYSFVTPGDDPSIDWPLMSRDTDFSTQFWASCDVLLNGYNSYGGGIIFTPTYNLPTDINDFIPENGYSNISIYDMINGNNQFYFSGVEELSGYVVGDISFRFWMNTDIGRIWSTVGVDGFY
jgi:hypothetical protein